MAIVTLKTIADRLGVSVTSVSNAFNRPDQLSPELRDRILATADELGYAGPDPRAMALRGNRVGAIALVGKALPAAFTDPASLLMLGGIAEACDEAGVALVLIPFSDHGGGRDDILRSVVVDGVVAHCDALDPARRGIIADRGLPLVVLDGRPVGDEPSVVIDDEGGARAAARHLLELGHVRLAVVRFAPLAAGLANLVEEQRMAGYRAAVAEAGLDPADLVVVEGAAYDRAATAAAVGELLDRPDRPTAVLAMSDEMAVATIEAARQPRAAGARGPVRGRLRRHRRRRHQPPAAHDGPPAPRRQGRRSGADPARRRPPGGFVATAGRAGRAPVQRSAPGVTMGLVG